MGNRDRFCFNLQTCERGVPCSKNWSVQMVHVLREANFAADFMASVASSVAHLGLFTN